MITKQKIKNIIIWLSVMLALTSLCVFHNSWNPYFKSLLFEKFNVVSVNKSLLVHFISVGSADAIAINLPDGKVMLIDSGTVDSNISYTKYIEQQVLNSKTCKKIDYLILTHADIDHTGGALRLLKNFDVEKVLMPKLNSDTIYYTELLNYVEQNCNYDYLSDKINLSTKDYIIDILGPLSNSSLNDSSPIIRLEYMQTSFLFTADISTKIEKLMIDEFGYRLDADVLKVAHHGSSTSTSSEFLSYVTPKYAVISVDKNSKYHPDDSVLQNINNANAHCLTTANCGNIMFAVGEDYSLKYKTENYWITNFNLDYRMLILVLNFVITIKIIVIIIKKEKRKRA